MRIRFSEGYYETEDKQEIRFLSEQSQVTVAETRDDLYEQAKDLGIEGRSQMDKEELAGEVVEEVLDE